MDWRDWVFLAELLVCLAGILWLVWPKARREVPLETGISFIVEDGSVISLFFDKRGHLVRTTIREPEIN